MRPILPRITDNADIPYFNGSKFRVADPEKEPDAGFHRKPTFLTHLDVSNRNLLNIDNYYNVSYEHESRKSKVSKFSEEDYRKHENDGIHEIIISPNEKALNNTAIIGIDNATQSTLKHDAKNLTL